MGGEEENQTFILFSFSLSLSLYIILLLGKKKRKMATWSTLFDNGIPNLSIFSLPITLFIAAWPHWYTIYLAESKKVQGGWSNENPRAFVARLNAKAATGKKLSGIEELILRGQSAQQNGFEWFPVWAIAVVSSLTFIPSRPPLLPQKKE